MGRRQAKEDDEDYEEDALPLVKDLEYRYDGTVLKGENLTRMIAELKERRDAPRKVNQYIRRGIPSHEWTSTAYVWFVAHASGKTVGDVQFEGHDDEKFIAICAQRKRKPEAKEKDDE